MAEKHSYSRNTIQRASKPKVKSGCITCKKRRVKCDESKPSCLRCEKFGCVCDGYDLPSRRAIRGTLKRVLFPKDGDGIPPWPKFSIDNESDQSLLHANETLPYQKSLVWDKTLVPVSFIAAPRSRMIRKAAPHAVFSDRLSLFSPSLNIFEDEQEQRYFRFYYDTTAHQLQGSFTDGTWSFSFLQAMQEEPFIRRSITAIAALSKAMEVVESEKRGVKSLPDINDRLLQSLSPDFLNNSPSCLNGIYSHHVFALQQYGKAIRQMREAIANGEENIRAALISCLLTVCFESFHGHHENALAQMNVGLGLMRDWLKKQPKMNQLTGLKSPNPRVVDDRLFHSFARLDVSNMHFFDIRPAEWHREESFEGSETLAQMPESFSDLEQAGVYFSVVMRRIMHFLKWAESAASGHRSYQKQCALGIEDMETKFNHESQHNSSKIILEEVERYGEELGRWSTTFQPLLENSKTPAGRSTVIPSAFLSLHESLIFVLLNGLRHFQECHFDNYLPAFRTMVATATLLLRHPDLAHSARRAVFIFDPNVVLPLLIVAMKCRDRVLRRKAVDLLQENPRREGTWDSSLAAGIGAWIMELEEKDLDSEIGDGEWHVGEENRVKLANVIQDFRGRTARLKATQVIGGETVTHETTISW